MKILLHKDAVFASKQKQSSKQITDKIVRCRSSNVWGYAFDPPDYGNVGTLYVQFKNEYGGPGDVYRYYNVPIRLYQKLVATPSKGHFHWKAIRNKFKYSKLTGDKRGKLPNAVNSR